MGRSRASLWTEHMNDQDSFIRSKFNGNIVMNITGLQNGKKLGEFIVYLKQTIFTHLDLVFKSQDEINKAIACEFIQFAKNRTGFGKNKIQLCN